MLKTFLTNIRYRWQEYKNEKQGIFTFDYIRWLLTNKEATDIYRGNDNLCATNSRSNDVLSDTGVD